MSLILSSVKECLTPYISVGVNIVDRINDVALRRARLVLGWVTVLGGHTTLVSLPIHPDQLRLLPSAGREMSKSDDALRLRSKAGSFLPHVDRIGLNMWVAGKTV